jgi:hypothetical protein
MVRPFHRVRRIFDRLTFPNDAVPKWEYSLGYSCIDSLVWRALVCCFKLPPETSIVPSFGDMPDIQP